MTFNQYIETNYLKLIRIAGAIFKNTNLDPSDIVAELYLDVVENNRKIEPTQNDYEYYCKRWLKNATRWKGGNPTKKLKITDEVNQEYRRRQLDIYNSPGPTGNETVKDLQRAGFSRDQADRLENCIVISKTLPLYHRRLFELYYIEGLSLNDIAISCSSNTCNVPKVSIHRDVKTVNNQIKNQLYYE